VPSTLATPVPLEDFLQELLEENVTPRRVQVVAHLPEGATVIEIAETLQEMESLARLFFAEEENSYEGLLRQNGVSLPISSRQSSHIRGSSIEELDFVAEMPTNEEVELGSGADREDMVPRLYSCQREVEDFCQHSIPFDVSRPLNAGEFSNVISCLQDHVMHASSKCAAAIRHLEVTKYCQSDVKSFCASVIPGDGRVHGCLVTNSVDISETCKKYLVEKKDEIKHQRDQQAYEVENNEVYGFTRVYTIRKVIPFFGHLNDGSIDYFRFFYLWLTLFSTFITALFLSIYTARLIRSCWEYFSSAEDGNLDTEGAISDSKENAEIKEMGYQPMTV